MSSYAIDKAQIFDFANQNDLFVDFQAFIKNHHQPQPQPVLPTLVNTFLYNTDFLTQEPPPVSALPPLDFSDSPPQSPEDSIASPKDTPSPLTQVFNALMASSQVQIKAEATPVLPSQSPAPTPIQNIASGNRVHGVNNATQYPGQFYYPISSQTSSAHPSIMSSAHRAATVSTAHATANTFPIGMDSSFMSQISNGQSPQMSLHGHLQIDPAFAASYQSAVDRSNLPTFNMPTSRSQHSSPESGHIQAASMPLSGNGRPQQPKRYRCPHPGCDKAFARNYNLGTHMSTHTGRKDFVCPCCPKAFSRKHDLGRHLQALHQPSPEKPIICPNCATEFHEVVMYQKHKCEPTR